MINTQIAQYTDGMHLIFKRATGLHSSWPLITHQIYFTMMLLTLIYIHLWSKFSVQYHLDFYSIYMNMDATDYWPMAREYSIWNTAIAALQFWTAHLDAHTLSNTIEEVYSAFFYTASAHTLHQQPDKILFGHFMTTFA